MPFDMEISDEFEALGITDEFPMGAFVTVTEPDYPEADTWQDWDGSVAGYTSIGILVRAMHSGQVYTVRPNFVRVWEKN